jgi:hypothetical protein
MISHPIEIEEWEIIERVGNNMETVSRVFVIAQTESFIAGIDSVPTSACKLVDELAGTI